MKAVLITKPGPPEVLQLSEVSTPPLSAPDDVRVLVSAAALNRADVLQRLGRYPAPQGAGQAIPGLEFAGTVEETGSEVTRYAPGERVMGLLGGGGYAEQVVTKERLLLPVPSVLSDEEAAGVPEVFSTAFDALFLQLGLAVGESLLIHAVGSGVGLAALQLAKTAGCVVYGTAGSDEKLRRASEYGLDVGINYRNEDFREVIVGKTAGQGVDAILELVGAPYWEKDLACLKVKGRLILVGLLGGRKAETDLGVLLNRRLTIIGTVLRAREIEEKMALTESLRARVLPLLAAGRVKPVIDRVFPLEQAAEAHAYMESNANFGKIILKVGR